MPAFNEADTIFKNLGELKGVLEALGRDYEIVVSDDGSADETFLEVKRFI
ncbi:MAG: glycosyltransferase, partial [Candidatus Hodarchaeota archaeon]